MDKSKTPFSDKMKGRNKEIILIDNDQVFTETNRVADILNNYFLDAVENLDTIPHSSTLITESEGSGGIQPGQIDNIITSYKDHTSILKIKEHVKIKEKFSFSKPTIENVYKILSSLDSKKATVENDIPLKVILATNAVTTEYITGIYHCTIDKKDISCLSQKG